MRQRSRPSTCVDFQFNQAFRSSAAVRACSRCRTFTLVTRVRIPLGTPLKTLGFSLRSQLFVPVTRVRTPLGKRLFPSGFFDAAPSARLHELLAAAPPARGAERRRREGARAAGALTTRGPRAGRRPSSRTAAADMGKRARRWTRPTGFSAARGRFAAWCRDSRVRRKADPVPFNWLLANAGYDSEATTTATAAGHRHRKLVPDTNRLYRALSKPSGCGTSRERSTPWGLKAGTPPLGSFPCWTFKARPQPRTGLYPRSGPATPRRDA